MAAQAAPARAQSDLVHLPGKNAPPAVVALTKLFAQLKPGALKVLPSFKVEEAHIVVSSTKDKFSGVANCVKYLARISGDAQLYGDDAIQQTQVDILIDLAQLQRADFYAQLNEHLALRSYLVGNHVTAADYFIWGAIVSTGAQIAGLANVARWLSLVSSLPECVAADPVAAAAAAAAAEKESKAKDAGGSFEIDLPGAALGNCVTRFPPEPSGYLHIGHVKALMLNYYFASKFKGAMILRFDDTNPTNEKEEFVDNIFKDLKTLGIEYSKLTYTSDSFGLCEEYADKLLRAGLAYIDKTPKEELRRMRGDREESSYRSQPVEENLRLWGEMKKASEEGLLCVMRAKINMQDDNACLRDPAMYRCNLVPHHRTGTKFKVYPTYDFSCPIVDAHEGVTHALRTLEYRDRNAQYEWFLQACGLRKVHIWEYSRLNLRYTVLSKRKLQWFVESNKVDGWMDPRFPTVQGILRRGMRVEALREFILSQGASKNTNLMTWDKIWSINKRIIDPVAPKYNAVSSRARCVVRLTNMPAPEVVDMPLHPKNPAVGSRPYHRTASLLIEPDDAAAIAQGEEVTLMGWGNAIINSITKGDDGAFTMEATLNLAGDFKKTEKKLNWVPLELPAPAQLVPCTLVEFDFLITAPKIEEDQEFRDVVNPNSRFETAALAEPAIISLREGDIVQLQRRGYFRCDKPFDAATGSPIVLFNIPDGHEKAMSTLSSQVVRKS